MVYFFLSLASWYYYVFIFICCVRFNTLIKSKTLIKSEKNKQTLYPPQLISELSSKCSFQAARMWARFMIGQLQPITATDVKPNVANSRDFRLQRAYSKHRSIQPNLWGLCWKIARHFHMAK